MRAKQAKKRIEKLKKVINYHRYLYHVLDKQEISDAALDSLKHELRELERQVPEFAASDSPTQRVGGAPLKKFKKIVHKVRQWSFEDVFSEDELREFDAKIKRMLEKFKVRPLRNKGLTFGELEYACELKIDGFKIILEYEKGILKSAATRGDGLTGEDVTQNIKTIESIPLRLEKEADVVVEGEIWMGKKEFERLNNEQEKNGLLPFANPRNAAAGAIRQLDSKIVAARKLDSFAYDLSYASFPMPNTQIKELKKLSELGFKVNKNFKQCRNIEEAIDFWKEWEKKSKKEDYWVDGIVVKLNRRDLQEMLGYTGKAPRFAVAFKFSAEQTTTIVEDIQVQVGRTGVLTPVAYLKPVLVAGSTVSRATLHNEEEIKRLGLKIGDTVIIQKAGDVIPEVVEVLKDLRNGKEKEFKMPSECPICGGRLEREKGSPIIRCVNKKCAVRHRRELYYFVSKSGFNIEGLGPKIINAFLDNGLVQDAADIFDLKEGDLAPLDRFGEKSAENIVKSIGEKREISLARFITALGILNVGTETAGILAERFGLIENLKKANIEELKAIKNIGEIVAESVFNWFKDRHNKIFLERLLKRIKIKNIEKKKGVNLEGKIFVLTGSLKSMSREDAKEKIRTEGGHTAESVSQNTDFVVAGEEPGLKYKKAKKLGVNILNEEQFLKMLK